MNRNNIFLTEKRRKVLNGESEWSEESIDNEKSRIRTRSRTALDELIEVAYSPEIDNSDIFDPKKLRELITILTRGPGGLDPWEPDEDYANSVHVAVDKAIHGIEADDLEELEE